MGKKKSAKALEKDRPFRPLTAVESVLLLIALVLFFCVKIVAHPTEMVWGNDLVRLDSVYKAIEHRSWNEFHTHALWDPTSFGGYSMTGDQGPGYVTPFKLLFWMADSSLIFGLYYMVQLFVGTCGMYLLARIKGCETFGAFCATISFCFCARVAGHLFAGHVGMIPAALALPWILYGLERLLQEHTLKDSLLFGLITALAVVNGPSVQVVYYHTLFVGSYALITLALMEKELGRSGVVRLGGLILIGVAIALAGSAAWWLPVVRQTLLLSARAEQSDIAFSSFGGARPSDLLRLIWPFYGVPKPEPLKSDVEMGFFWATGSFVGITTLTLACAGIAKYLRTPRIVVLPALGFVAGLVALGENTWLYTLAYNYLPGFSFFRVPSRLFLYLDLSLALMAGLFISNGKSSIDRFYAGAASGLMLQIVLFLTLARVVAFQTGDAVLWTLAVSAILATATATWSTKLVPRHWWQMVMLLLVAGEMFMFWQQHVYTVKPETRFPRLATLEYLEKQREEEPFRVLDSTGLLEQHLAAQYGLEIVSGYHATVYKYYLALYKRIWKSDTSDSSEVELHSPREIACPGVLDLLNVKFLVAEEPSLEELGLTLVYQSPPAELRRPVFIYRRETLPRAFVVSKMSAPMDGTALDAICSFKPTEECLVDDEPSEGTAAYQALQPTVHSFSDFSMEFETTAPGVVVLSSAWHPDWRAEDNGQAKSVRRVNHALVGIPVEAGTHKLRIRYYPWDFYLGCAVSLLSCSIAGMLLLYILAKNRDLKPARCHKLYSGGT